MIVSHLLLILHNKILFYIFMFEAWNVAKGRKVQGVRILSQGTVCESGFSALISMKTKYRHRLCLEYYLRQTLSNTT